MFHDFVDWLQHGLGKAGEDGQSWSEQLHESLSLWNVTEGTHVLTLMFFAGTIWIIDLRMMGVAFRNVPFSKLNDRVLPITIFAFAAMIVTGVIAFFGRDPLLYYHDIWFRLKMIFLVIASANIFWFHYMVQKTQATWDNDPTPPARVRLSGLVSMVCWIMIITFGRLIAYDYLRCEKVPEGSFVYWFAECKQAMNYLDGTEEGGANDQTTDDTSSDSTTPDDAAPAEATPADATTPADAAKPPAEKPGGDAKPATPAKPKTPGQGG